MSQVLSVPASSNGTVTLPYVPQWLGILPGAAGTINSLQGKTLGVGNSIDLDAVGINILGRPRLGGSFSGGNRMFLVPCADGVLTNKTLQVDLTTGAGGAVTVHAFGQRKGQVPYINGRTTANTGTPLSLKGFFAVGGDLTGTDNITVIGRPLFEDEEPLNQQLSAIELNALANLYGNYSTGSNWDIAVLDNWSRSWDEIIISPAATRSIYYTRAAL